MPQTDRQTDTTARSSWWFITAYNDDIGKCTQNEAWPTWVRKIVGGPETCPTTGKEHYQAVVNTQQIRFKQLKTWLSNTHIQVCDDIAKAKSYCMKKETASGIKQTIESVKQYYSMDSLLTLLGYYELQTKNTGEYQDFYRPISDQVLAKVITQNAASKMVYWYLVQKVLENKGPYLISSYSKSDMFNSWDNLRSFWITESLSITETPDQIEEPPATEI